MNISNITPPQVWTSSSRSLTNIGTGAIAATGVSRTSLAANTAVDLRPSAGTFGQITVSGLTGSGATGAFTIFAFDGVNSQSMVASAAASLSPIAFTSINVPGQGVQIKNNDATVAATYITMGFVWTQ